MEKADLFRRSLSDKEKQNLRSTIRTLGQLRDEKRTAPVARAVAIDVEIRSLNQRCDVIVGAQ